MSYASRWERASPGSAHPDERLPHELLALKDRLGTMSPAVRAELEPVVADALEQARFRGRILALAREALDRLRLDLTMTRFDLEITRREREELRQRMNSA